MHQFFCQGFWAMPNSLVGWVYKLSAKVLANRLKLAADTLISNSQNVIMASEQFLGFGAIAN